MSKINKKSPGQIYEHTETTIPESSPKDKEKKQFGIKNKLDKKIYYAFLSVLALLICIIGGILGGFLSTKFFFLGTKRDDSSFQSSGEESLENSESNSSQINSEFLISDIAEKNIKSVVAVNIDSDNATSSSTQYSSSVSGSGVIISEDGYIIINNHLISVSNKINVTVDGKSFDAKIIGSDSTFDIALIKIEKTGLQPAILGDSDSIRLAEDILAIGSPFNRGCGSITKGIVSALDRSITIDKEIIKLIQIDASIASGSSGGGLFNGKGELMGILISKSKSVSTEGMGFAIPINDLKKSINNLKEYGIILGKADMEMKTIDSGEYASEYNYNSGVVITEISENSNAKNAGFEVGDCIVSIDSKEVLNTISLNKILKDYSAGDIVSVEIRRKEENLILNLQLAEKN